MFVFVLLVLTLLSLTLVSLTLLSLTFCSLYSILHPHDEQNLAPSSKALPHCVQNLLNFVPSLSSSSYFLYYTKVKNMSNLKSNNVQKSIKFLNCQYDYILNRCYNIAKEVFLWILQLFQWR